MYIRYKQEKQNKIRVQNLGERFLHLREKSVIEMEMGSGYYKEINQQICYKPSIVIYTGMQALHQKCLIATTNFFKYFSLSLMGKFRRFIKFKNTLEIYWCGSVIFWRGACSPVYGRCQITQKNTQARWSDKIRRMIGVNWITKVLDNKQ